MPRISEGKCRGSCGRHLGDTGRVTGGSASARVSIGRDGRYLLPVVRRQLLGAGAVELTIWKVEAHRDVPSCHPDLMISGDRNIQFLIQLTVSVTILIRVVGPTQKALGSVSSHVFLRPMNLCSGHCHRPSKLVVVHMWRPPNPEPRLRELRELGVSTPAARKSGHATRYVFGSSWQTEKRYYGRMTCTSPHCSHIRRQKLEGEHDDNAQRKPLSRAW